jgi:hypothetical protein
MGWAAGRADELDQPGAESAERILQDQEWGVAGGGMRAENLKAEKRSFARGSAEENSER